MRKIIFTALVAFVVAAAGCSKKTEEHAEEGMSAPAPMEKTAPESAPMEKTAPESAPMEDMGTGEQATPAPGMESMPEEQAPASSEEN